MTRTKSMTVFCLLIAALQFAGGGIVTNIGGGPSATEYFCCCAGECHCTADCCNHAPADENNVDSSLLRIGAGSPVLEAPRSCGTWTCTLSRSPESPKALSAFRQPWTEEPPDNGFLQSQYSVVIVSSQALLKRLAPRAPPCL